MFCFQQALPWLTAWLQSVGWSQGDLSLWYYYTMSSYVNDHQYCLACRVNGEITQFCSWLLSLSSVFWTRWLCKWARTDAWVIAWFVKGAICKIVDHWFLILGRQITENKTQQSAVFPRTNAPPCFFTWAYNRGSEVGCFPNECESVNFISICLIWPLWK